MTGYSRAERYKADRSAPAREDFRFTPRGRMYICTCFFFLIFILLRCLYGGFALYHFTLEELEIFQGFVVSEFSRHVTCGNNPWEI